MPACPTAMGVPEFFFESDLTLARCHRCPPSAHDTYVNTPANTPLSITLLADDDGLPDPPGALDYILTSLPANGLVIDAAAGPILAAPHTLIEGSEHRQLRPLRWFPWCGQLRLQSQ